MENLPGHIQLVFYFATIATVFILLKATRFSIVTIGILLILLIVQVYLAFSEFLTDFTAFPPRPFFLLMPSVIIILVLFTTKKGRDWLNGLDTKTLTWIHMVRIPVELVLYWLCLSKVVSPLMTFEGINFDILSGITAIPIAYFGYHKKKLSKPILLIWNFICLGLLINIVTVAILCLPSPFQQLSFDQPNIAVLYFPYVWLPGIIVPAVLFSHLVCIRELVRAKNKE